VDTTGEPDLLARARKGELDAFNALVERYQGPIYNLCLRMLGSPQAAEDAAQEAFISAYRHLERFRGEAFRSWLYRIAANACYDELRRRKARPSVSLDQPYADEDSRLDPPSGEPALEEHAEQMQLREALQAALANLPAEQRLAIVLCDVQGMDYAEIAAVTRTSLGTVKSRINRGRLRLRVLLQAQAELLPSRFRHSGEET